MGTDLLLLGNILIGYGSLQPYCHIDREAQLGIVSLKPFRTNVEASP